MLNLISIAIGLIALFFALPAFVPGLGALNWLIVPVAVVGLAIGLFSSRRSGRNLNLLVIVIGVVRLFLGGGIL